MMIKYIKIGFMNKKIDGNFYKSNDLPVAASAESLSLIIVLIRDPTVLAHLDSR